MRHILPTVLLLVVSMFKKLSSFNLGTTCENIETRVAEVNSNHTSMSLTRSDKLKTNFNI